MKKHIQRIQEQNTTSTTSTTSTTFITSITTETQHTPGPWMHKATASLGPQYAVYPEDSTTGAVICIVYDHGNTEANARLIAAAPELLEALRDIVRAHDVKMGKGAVKLRIELARVAIAKAVTTEYP